MNGPGDSDKDSHLKAVASYGDSTPLVGIKISSLTFLFLGFEQHQVILHFF